MSKSGNNISLQLTDSGYDGLLHDCRKTGLEATITFPIAPHASAGVKWASGQIVKSRDEQVAHKNQEDGPMFLPAEGSRVALPSEQDNRRKNVLAMLLRGVHVLWNPRRQLLSLQKCQGPNVNGQCKSKT
eukprot:tig00001229_g7844.t1